MAKGPRSARTERRQHERRVGNLTSQWLRGIFERVPEGFELLGPRSRRVDEHVFTPPQLGHRLELVPDPVEQVFRRRTRRRPRACRKGRFEARVRKRALSVASSQTASTKAEGAPAAIGKGTRARLS